VDEKFAEDNFTENNVTEDNFNAEVIPREEFLYAKDFWILRAKLDSKRSKRFFHSINIWVGSKKKIYIWVAY
jgi:hypothetical protein